MRHAVSRDLHDYWDRLRAGRTAPERGDIDPAAIRHILAYTFVLDVPGSARPRAGDVTFRLSGTRLNALFGRDLRGCGFDRIWTGRGGILAGAVLDSVLEDRAAVVASAHGGPPGRSAIDLELLLLPLRHHGRTHARILGALSSPEVPNWMGLSAAAPLDLLSFRALSAHPGAAPRSARGHDPDRTLPTPTPAAVRVGSFRVYEGGRGRTSPAEAIR